MACTLFRLTLAGKLKILHSFKNLRDGEGPDALLVGPGGDLYGTTLAGGRHPRYVPGGGTFFKITLRGDLTTLASFPYPSSPMSLVRGENGDFYGYTQYGGMWEGGNVFEVTPTGTMTDLSDFYPYYGNDFIMGQPSFPGQLQGVTSGSGGRIYGVTTFGGQFSYGTIYRLRPPDP